MLALLGFACAAAAPVFLGKVPIAADVLALWGPLAATNPQPVHNPVLADSALLFLPWQVFVRHSLGGGEWPLWDPHLFAGYPFLGNNQNQIYYPVTWILWSLPLPQAIQVSTILHLWLAGVGMYALARVLGTSRTGSVLAGLAFAGCGQLYTALELPAIADIIIWLPWVVAASELAWRKRSWTWTAISGLLYGILTVSGHLQWFIYSSAFLALWLTARLYGLAWDIRRRPPPADGWGWRGRAVRAGAILAWGPALAAIQLLPFAELIRLSNRATAAGLAVPPDTLDTIRYYLGRKVVLLVPLFLGTPVGSIGESFTYNTCWYVGLGPLVMALLALLLRRERRVLFLSVVGLVAFATGADLPLFNRLHQLPGLQAQIPFRVGYIFIVCVTAVSGLGLDAWLRLVRRRPLIGGGVIIALVALALLPLNELMSQHQLAATDPKLYELQNKALDQAAVLAGVLLVWTVGTLVLRGDHGSWRRAALAGGLLGLTSVDLLTYAPGYNTYVAPDTLQPQARAADLMRADPDPWRMIAPDAPNPMFVPNTSILYDLNDVQGYDSLHLSLYEDYWAAADPKVREGGYFNVMLRLQSYLSPQANLLNVRYVTTWSPLNAVRQAQAEETVGEVSNRPIAEVFRSPEHLTSITVAFDTGGRVNHAPVHFHVRRVMNAPEDLVTQTVDPSQWRGKPWITFQFPPLDVPKDTRIVFVLDSPGSHPGDAPLVRASKGDTYPDGAMFMGGQWQTTRDLAFVARGTLPPQLERTYEEDVAVYTNKAALPRAFVVGAAEVLPVPVILARISEPDFDPRRVVLLEQAPPTGFPASPGDPTSPGTVRITQYHNLSVDLAAQMDRPGWLVLGDVNYPGWTVTVDGRPAPLYNAYALLRAVPLEAGTHTIRFTFQPLSVLLGGVISGVALLLAIAVIGRDILRRRTSLQVRADTL